MTEAAETPAPKQEASPPQRPRMFHAIDGMRGVAILIVVLNHIPDVRFRDWMPGGFYVVDLFFAMSGFVVAHVYEARVEQGKLSAWGFMRLRLIRAYPMYWLALALAVATIAGVMVLRGRFDDPIAFIASAVVGATLLPMIPALSYRHHHLYPFNGPAWTMLWELLVNAIWAVIAPRLSNRLLAVILAIGVGLLVWCAMLPGGFYGGGNFESWHVGAMRAVYGYFAGVAAYRIWKAGLFAKFRLSFWVVSAIILAEVVLRPEALGVWFDVPVMMAMPVLVLASTGDPAPWLRPILARIGLISYALYILHFPLLLALDTVLGRIHGLSIAKLGLPGYALYVVTALIVADVAEHRISHPMRKWLTERLAPRKNRGHVPGDRPN